jgi:hypothetical protein
MSTFLSKQFGNSTQLISAFIKLVRLLKNSPEIMELPWNGYCGRPFGSFCSSGLDSVQLCYFR